MTATEMDAEEAPKKGSKKPMIIGLALALIMGGGGFFAVHTGMILGGGGEAEAHATPDHGETAALEVGFVPIDPLVVSLGHASRNRHLRFNAQLEVGAGKEDEVIQLLPRVVDVLNGYLRAVDVAELEDPTALVRLRAQMLRRIQIVVGEGRVRDLLIMEFVLN